MTRVLRKTLGYLILLGMAAAMFTAEAMESGVVNMLITMGLLVVTVVLIFGAVWLIDG